MRLSPGASSLRFGALRREFALAVERQLALILLPQRREARPEISADEQEQERHGQVVEGIDGVHHHPGEESAAGDLRIRKPTAAATVPGLLEPHRLLIADGVFRSPRELRLVAD